MDINERLKQVRQHFKLSQREACEKLETHQVYYSRVERGAIKLTDKFQKKVVDAFGVSAEWLKDGNGEMMPSKTSNSSKNLIEYTVPLTEDEISVLDAVARDTANVLVKAQKGIVADDGRVTYGKQVYAAYAYEMALRMVLARRKVLSEE